MQGEDGLPVAREHHQITLPMAGGGAVQDLLWSVGDRHPALYMQR